MSAGSSRSGPARVLIVGGGIGGMAAALALRRIGVDAAIFERGGDTRRIQVGGGYSIWQGGMGALRELGLIERAEAVGGAIESFEYHSAGGGKLAEWAVGELGRRKCGATPTGIMRPDLHRIFVDAVGEGSIAYDRACTGFTEDEEGVSAHFADGREERGDLLVGADGLESVVRARVVGDTPLRPTGYAHWFGFVDLERELTPNRTFRILYGRGSRFAFLPISPTRLCWWCTVPGARAEGAPAADVKPWLLERFRGWAFPVEAVIDATATGAIARRDTFDRRPVRKWGKGRVTLLGDAAHPMTFNVGQGAGTAMKDGVMLANYLAAYRAAGGDVTTALRAYEASRMGITARLNRVSRAVGAASAWQNPAACWLHDWILRLGRRPVVSVLELDTDFSMPGSAVL